MKWVVVLLAVSLIAGLFPLRARRRTRRRHDQLDTLKRTVEREDPFKIKGDDS